MIISQVGMSLKKRNIRRKFRDEVFARDNHRCVKCGTTQLALDNSQAKLDAHHITNRNDMEDGGYILSNGISLCPSCHWRAEIFHSSGSERWHDGYHPDDLKKLIHS